jgi:hypothetical protein
MVLLGGARSATMDVSAAHQMQGESSITGLGLAPADDHVPALPD